MPLNDPIWAETPTTPDPITVSFPGETVPEYKDPGVGTPVGSLDFPDRAIVRSFFEGDVTTDLTVAEPTDCAFTPAWKLNWSLLSVWDVVLIDALDDDVCTEETQLVGNTRQFLGGAGELQLKGEVVTEADSTVRMSALTNAVLPSGLGGESLFRNLYLQISASSPGAVAITPIVDGIRYPEARKVVLPFGTSAEPQFYEYEFPLTSDVDFGTKGLRGGWFQAEICAANLFPCGRVLIGGMELEHEVVREGVEHRTFGEVPVAPLAFNLGTRNFLGFGGKLGLYGADEDLGSTIAIHALSNVLAPEGVGGECSFRNLYFSLYRANSVQVTLTVTLYIDNVAQTPVEWVLPAVEEPVQEDYEQPLMESFEGKQTYGMRGTWLQAEVTTDVSPGGPFEVMGLEAEYEKVRESTKAVTSG